MLTAAGGVVGIECDEPGCNHSKMNADNRSNAREVLLRQAGGAGWALLNTMERVKHLCPKCARNHSDAIPLQQHFRPDGSLVMRGAQDPTNMLDGVVVAAQAKRAINAGEFVTDKDVGIVRAKRKKDADRGTPGVSEMTPNERKALADKFAKAQRTFQISIQLKDDED